MQHFTFAMTAVSFLFELSNPLLNDRTNDIMIEKNLSITLWTDRGWQPFERSPQKDLIEQKDLFCYAHDHQLDLFDCHIHSQYVFLCRDKKWCLHRLLLLLNSH